MLLFFVIWPAVLLTGKTNTSLYVLGVRGIGWGWGIVLVVLCLFISPSHVILSLECFFFFIVLHSCSFQGHGFLRSRRS